jgi:hypothetical protein
MIVQIAMDKIPVKPPIGNVSTFKELINVVLETGPLPVWVIEKDGGYAVVSGFEMFHACLFLKHKTIAAHILPPATQVDPRVSTLEKHIRKYLSPIIAKRMKHCKHIAELNDEVDRIIGMPEINTDYIVLNYDNHRQVIMPLSTHGGNDIDSIIEYAQTTNQEPAKIFEQVVFQSVLMRRIKATLLQWRKVPNLTEGTKLYKKLYNGA